MIRLAWNIWSEVDGGLSFEWALMLTLVVIGIVFAGPLVELFAAAYREVPGKLELTVFLTRLMLPFLTFVAVAAACMGMWPRHPSPSTPFPKCSPPRRVCTPCGRCRSRAGPVDHAAAAKAYQPRQNR